MELEALIRRDRSKEHGSLSRGSAEANSSRSKSKVRAMMKNMFAFIMKSLNTWIKVISKEGNDKGKRKTYNEITDDDVLIIACNLLVSPKLGS